MPRLSCVQNCLCPDYRAFKIAYVQTIVRSKLHMSRLSCVQNCICPDYRAFIFFSRPCNFERTTPPCAFISVWTYRLSVWDLNLGYLLKPIIHNFLHLNYNDDTDIVENSANLSYIWRQTHERFLTNFVLFFVGLLDKGKLTIMGSYILGGRGLKWKEGLWTLPMVKIDQDE